MGYIQLIDLPETLIRTNEETNAGRPVRWITSTAAAQMANYLNFYARRVIPWSDWQTGSGGIYPTSFSFVAPIDGTDYSQRILTCVFRLSRVDSQDSDVGYVQLDVTSSTGGSVTAVVVSGNAINIWDNDNEGNMVYAVVDVDVTGSKREEMIASLNTAMSATSWAFCGYGAWELPPKSDGTVAGDFGLALGTASCPDTASEAVKHYNYYIGSPVDTDANDINKASIPGFNKHRRVIHNLGVIDTPNNRKLFELSTATVGGGYLSTWTSVLPGGLVIPAYCARNGDTTRNLRMAIRCITTVGSAAWRVVTSTGNGSTDTMGTNNDWRPMESSGTYDPDVDGYSFTVGTSTEWIDIEVTQDNANDARIHQIIIWEDVYDADES